MSELFKDNGPFTINIAELDEEHARLHVEAKRVAILVSRGENMSETAKAVADFTDSMESHFRHEETYFNTLPPFRAEEHRKEHEMLILSLRLFAKSLQDRDGLKNWKDFTGLEDLLLKHVILFDLELRPESKDVHPKTFRK